MSLVHGMRKETAFVMKQKAIHRVVDPTYSESGITHGHSEMIFHPEDLNNQLADEYLKPEQSDANYIKSLSLEEKRALLKQLEDMERAGSVENDKTKIGRYSKKTDSRNGNERYKNDDSCYGNDKYSKKDYDYYRNEKDDKKQKKINPAELHPDSCCHLHR